MTTVVSGKLTISDYSPYGDRLWLEINGGKITLSRGWSPSPSSPLEKLGELPDDVQLDVLNQLQGIANTIFEAYRNWRV